MVKFLALKGALEEGILCVRPSVRVFVWLLPQKNTANEFKKHSNESRGVLEQTGKQAGKQAGKKAGKQAGEQAGKQTGKQAGKQTSKQESKQASKQASK